MKNVNFIISRSILRKSRTLTFIIVIIVMACSLIFPQVTPGGEIYTYKDKDGVTVVSNTPIPERYERKAQKIDSYNEMKPSEIQTREHKDQRTQASYINIQQEQMSPSKGKMQKEKPYCYTHYSKRGYAYKVCEDEEGEIVSEKRLRRNLRGAH